MKRALLAFIFSMFLTNTQAYGVAITPPVEAIANSRNCSIVPDTPICRRRAAVQAAREAREEAKKRQELLQLAGPALATVGALQNRFGGKKKKKSAAILSNKKKEFKPLNLSKITGKKATNKNLQDFGSQCTVQGSDCGGFSALKVDIGGNCLCVKGEGCFTVATTSLEGGGVTHGGRGVLKNIGSDAAFGDVLSLNDANTKDGKKGIYKLPENTNPPYTTHGGVGVPADKWKAIQNLLTKTEAERDVLVCGATGGQEQNSLIAKTKPKPKLIPKPTLKPKKSSKPKPATQLAKATKKSTSVSSKLTRRVDRAIQYRKLYNGTSGSSLRSGAAE